MLTDLQLADLLLAQYANGASRHVAGVDFTIQDFGDCTVIAFQGSHTLPDWESDFDADMVHAHGFRVHDGFYRGLETALIAAKPDLPMDRPLYVIGHSLGAARAHIFTAILIGLGYKNLETVVFGSPAPGDSALAALLLSCPSRSYWNWRDAVRHDLVGDVPIWTIVFPYCHPRERIKFNVAPPPGDNWGFLARHHMQLYKQGLEKLNG